MTANYSASEEEERVRVYGHVVEMFRVARVLTRRAVVESVVEVFIYFSLMMNDDEVALADYFYRGV